MVKQKGGNTRTRESLVNEEQKRASESRYFGQLPLLPCWTDSLLSLCSLGICTMMLSYFSLLLFLAPFSFFDFCPATISGG